MRTLIFSLCLLVSSAFAAETDYPRGKLPAGVTPLSYRLDLTIVPDEARFSGHAEIDVELKADTQSIYLHGRELKMTSVVAVRGTDRITAKYAELDNLGTARVDLARRVPAGKLTLSFDYDAPFGDGPSGLYRIKVGDDWYSWTQFEAIDARAAFPSFDEPGFKTPYTVSLTTKPGLLALSNAPASGQPIKAGALVKHTFAPTKPLPTYLIAFVVGPFVTVEGVAPPNAIRKTPLPLRIVATKAQAGKLDYALAATPRIVELLEKYFGTAFPFPKLDQIASPVMGGAMENAGADIYDDDILLLDRGASTHQKQVFGMVVAHELAHQWFGDDVTPAWWDDIWLNESFANWMGYRIGNEWRPELNIGVNAIQEALEAMNTDALQAGRPIHQKITTNGQIDSAFDKITYGKGGQVVAMIASYLGDEKFKSGVRLHLQRHPYGNATSDEFFTALADAGKDPRVLKSMQSFVYQQGLPVVDLVRDGNGYKATQSRYTMLGTPSAETQWIIPFCVRRSETRSCTLIDKKSQSITADGQGALVPNAAGTGYYRYNLSTADWDALIALGPKLPAGEGLAASDSLWAQFSAGTVSAAQVIKAARSFVHNPDSNVAVHGGWQLAAWRDSGWLSDTSLDDYRRLMNSIYHPRLTKLGFNPRAGAHAADNPDDQKLRQDLVVLVADEAHDANTRKSLNAAASAFLRGDASGLDQAFYPIALRVHVQDGTLTTTQDLYARLIATQDELLRGASLLALGSNRRATDTQWLLTQFKDTRLRATEKLELMSELMKHEETRDLAFDWLKANYDEFAKGAGIFAATIIPSLPEQYCSAEKAQEIDRLLRPGVQKSGRGELSFNRMLEGIQVCATLKKTKGAEIAAALK
jgi:aminopeptidase N